MSQGEQTTQQRPMANQSLLELLIEKKPTLDIPHHDNKPLLKHNKNSVRLTIMPEAWQDAGIDLDDPGCVQQYYFADDGLLVVDLEQDRERR